jgi:hypothetical protein
MYRSDEEMIRIGKLVDATACGDMSRRHADGSVRPLTNIEMLGWSMYKRSTEKETRRGRTDDRDRND